MGSVLVPSPSLPGCAHMAAAEIGPGPPVWVLALGTTYGEAKVWPVSRVAEFVTLVVRRDGVRVLLVGDEHAVDFARAVRQATAVAWRDQAAGPAGVVDLTGRTRLHEVVAVLKSATAFIGNDSGLMHLAGALGVATVGIFGSSNPAWTAPRGRRTSCVTAAGFDCHPCYLKRCPQSRFCLDSVAAETVAESVRDLLSRGEGNSALATGGAP